MEDDIIVATKDYNTSTNMMPNLDEETNSNYKKFTTFSPQKEQSQKFEVIQSYRPAKNNPNKEYSRMIDEYNNYGQYNETLSLQRPKGSLVISKKNLIYCSIIALICIALFVIIMVNDATIKGLNANIAKTNQNIAEVQINIDDIVGNIQDLSSEETIGQSAQQNGMTQVDESQIQKVNLIEFEQVQKYQRQTNVFDAICNFISALFGGN